MISVCIPVFNFNISELVTQLSRQFSELDAPCEIICIDDFSAERYRITNKAACTNHTYIELDRNIGRAKIRNLFLAYAKNDFLLFLDCDSLITSPRFLLNYIQAIENETPIICGGRIYPSQAPEREKLLRWKYGINRESQSVEVRQLSPNKSFMTNNFLISRTLFETIKFDERLTDYGHEDTLFGFELKKRGIGIKHIDNPVLNGDLETNTEYLKKTENGIINLVHILEYLNYDKEFIEDVNLLNFYEKLKSRGLSPVLKVLFIGFKSFFKFLLVRGLVNLKVFDFYKLGLLNQNFRYGGL